MYQIRSVVHSCEGNPQFGGQKVIDDSTVAQHTEQNDHADKGPPNESESGVVQNRQTHIHRVSISCRVYSE